MVFLFGVVLFVGVVLLVVGSTAFFVALNLVIDHGVTLDIDALLTLIFFLPFVDYLEIVDKLHIPEL